MGYENQHLEHCNAMLCAAYAQGSAMLHTRGNIFLNIQEVDLLHKRSLYSSTNVNASIAFYVRLVQLPRYSLIALKTADFLLHSAAV